MISCRDEQILINYLLKNPAVANSELSKFGLILLISEKKNRGRETGIQKLREKILYHLLKVQWLGLFLLYPSIQAPEQLLPMTVI